jgi:hypothetical protein
MKQAIQQAKSLLEKGSPGPLAEAGRSEHAKVPVPVRITEANETADIPLAREVPVAGSVSQNNVDDEGREEGLAEAMAALKARFGGGAPAPRVQAPVAVAAPVVEPVAVEVPVFAEPAALPVDMQPSPNIQAVDLQVSPDLQAAALPADLQASVVTFFQTSKNMLATGLAQTYGWKESGSRVVCAVAKPFVHTLLVQESAAITTAVSQLLGRPVGFEVRLELPSSGGPDGTAANEMPVQIEKIRQMFRGTIQ